MMEYGPQSNRNICIPVCGCVWTSYIMKLRKCTQTHIAHRTYTQKHAHTHHKVVSSTISQTYVDFVSVWRISDICKCFWNVCVQRTLYTHSPYKLVHPFWAVGNEVERKRWKPGKGSPGWISEERENRWKGNIWCEKKRTSQWLLLRTSK